MGKIAENELKKELQQYQAAFRSEFLLLFEVNVTEDLLEKELEAWIDGQEQRLLPLVDMEAPCRFTDFIRTWAGRYVLPVSRAAFLDFFQLDNLIQNYREGNRRIYVDYHLRERTKKEGFCIHRIHVTLTRDENRNLTALCAVRDVTAQMRKEQRLYEKLESITEANKRLQLLDELTGCVNREGFYIEAERILAENPDCTYALYYSDISNLAYINSVFGYEVGNQLLKLWSSCVREQLDSDEVFGRISGDYFAMLVKVSDVDRKDTVERTYAEILERLKGFLGKYDRHFLVQIYSGVYLVAPGDKDRITVAGMLNRAAIAQANAKCSGKKLAYYNEEQWEKRRREIDISQHLTNELDSGQIEIWVQPQYNCITGKISGAEILSRWKSSFMGNVSPVEFIPVLEKSGQIYELDTYIWECTCKHIRKWMDEGKKNIVPLSVNISRRDIMEEDLKEFLSALIEKYHFSPQMLHLEITESAYMEESEKLIKTVEELQDLGFTIEMDDFGSGYSSLNMLKEVPVDVLKMDLRFLTSNGNDKRGGNIISSVIRMAQGLNLEVIAEGVETAAQATILKNMGCSIMQGYYFAKPMPMKEFEKLLDVQQGSVIQEKVIDTDLRYINDILDTSSKSSYIFNHYIGSAALVQFDGENLEIISMNDEFVRVMGDKTGFSRNFMKDGLGLVQETDRPGVLEAVYKAVAEGRAECEMYLPRTRQWLRATYRYLVRSGSVFYLFCEAVNITEQHQLAAQLSNLAAEVNTEIDMFPTGAFRYEADGRQEFAYISGGMLALLKYPSLEAFQNKFHNNFPEMVYKEDRERVLAEINEQIEETGDKDYCEYRVETGDGELKWVYDHGHLVTDEDGKRWFYVVIGDLEQVRRGRRESLGIGKTRQHEICTQIPGVITFHYDPWKDRLTINKTNLRGEINQSVYNSFLEGMEKRHAVTAETIRDVHRAYKEAASRPVSGSLRFEWNTRDKGCVCYRCFYSSVADKDGKIRQIIGSAMNLEKEQQEVFDWKQRAQKDEMTDLLNHDTTIQTIQNCQKEHMGGILMMLDVDDFKSINDSKGHLFGDEILKKISRVLKEKFRKDDVIGRFGGDEFIVFLPGVFDEGLAGTKARDLLDALNKIFINEERSVNVSVGIAIDRTGQEEVEKLLERADALMYEAKKGGKNQFKM